MKMPFSTELVMQLAGQEAVAGRFGEIEPEQLLLAVLKLGELPVQKLGGIAPGAEILGQLTKEVQSLRDELKGRGIDSTQSRRRLRAELGYGTSEHPPSPIHRSEAAKKVFDEAARLAHKEHAPAMTTVHLLRALLASPTPAMVKVLGSGAGPGAAGLAKSPLLDRYGRGLTRLVREGRLSAVQGRQAETKGLLGFLASNSKSATFLVTDSDEVARDVVIAAAVAVSGGTAGPSLKDCRILDISDTCRPDAANGLTRLHGILEEAAASSNIVLLLPAISDVPHEDSSWIAALRTSIEKRQAKIICRVSAEAYAALLAGDSAWKRLVQPIWLRERVGDEIPQEL